MAIARACFLAAAILLPATSFAQDRQTCATAYEQAQYARRDSKLRAARAALLVCAQRACGGAAADCTQWLSEVEKSLPSIVFAVKTASGEELTQVSISMDGEHVLDTLDGNALVVDPGVHRLRFEANGHDPLEQSVTIRAGEKNRLLQVVFPSLAAEDASAPKVIPKPAPTQVRVRPVVPAVVVGSLGLASTLAAILVGVAAKNDLTALQNECRGQCDAAAVQPRKDSIALKGYISDALLGVGIAAVGSGILIFALGGKTKTAPTATIQFYGTAFGSRFSF